MPRYHATFSGGAVVMSRILFVSDLGLESFFGCMEGTVLPLAKGLLFLLMICEFIALAEQDAECGIAGSFAVFWVEAIEATLTC